MDLDERRTAEHEEVDFAAQVTSDHEPGSVEYDWAALSLRTLSSPRHAVMSKT